MAIPSIGGLDSMKKVAEVFDAQINTLTALSQRLMGDTGVQDTTRNAATSNVIAAASRNAPSAGSNPGSAVAPTGVGTWGTGGGSQASRDAVLQATRESVPHAPDLNTIGGQIAGLGARLGPGGFASPEPVAGGAHATPEASPGGGGNRGGGRSGYTYPVPVGGGRGGGFNGLGNALGMIPVAGPVLKGITGLASDIQGEFLNQKNQNLWYRTYGGDTSMMQEFGDRVGAWTSQFSHLGTFNSAESQQLYKQATAMGYTSNTDANQGALTYNKGDYMNFAAKAKNDLGFSPDQFGAMMNGEIQNGNETGIGSLIDSIKSLQTEAGKAGVNVEQATQQMLQYTTALQGTYGGTGGQQAASTLAQQQAGAGAAAQGQDWASVYQNQPFMTMVASQSGQTLGTLQSTGAGNFSQMQSTVLKASFADIDNWLKGALGNSYQTLMGYIKQMLPDGAKVGSVSNIAGMIFQAWFQDPSGGIGNLYPSMFLNVLNTFTGYKATKLQDAFVYLITTYYAGSNSTMAHSRTAAVGRSDFNASGTALNGPDKGKHVSGQGSQAVNAFANKFNSGANAPLVKSFTDEFHRTGTYNGTGLQDVTALANDMDPNQQFLIHTKKGMAVLTIEQIIKQGFIDQVISGRAHMVGGPHAGKTIAAMSGATTDNSVDMANASNATFNKTTDTGSLLSSLGKNYKGGANQLSVDLTGERGGTVQNQAVQFVLTMDRKLQDLVMIKSGTVQDQAGVPRNIPRGHGK